MNTEAKAFEIPTFRVEEPLWASYFPEKGEQTGRTSKCEDTSKRSLEVMRVSIQGPAFASLLEKQALPSAAENPFEGLHLLAPLAIPSGNIYKVHP